MPTLRNNTEFSLGFEGQWVEPGAEVTITNDQAARVAPTGVWTVVPDAETKLEEAARLLLEADAAERAAQ